MKTTSEKWIVISAYDNRDDNNNLIDNLTDTWSLKAFKVLNDIRHMNSNRLVTGQLSINSLRNKLTSLSTVIKDNIDIRN